MVTTAGWSIGRAATITAVRHAMVRDGLERQVINYPSLNIRLVPLIALACIHRVGTIPGKLVLVLARLLLKASRSRPAALTPSHRAPLAARRDAYDDLWRLSRSLASRSSFPIPGPRILRACGGQWAVMDSDVGKIYATISQRRATERSLRWGHGLRQERKRLELEFLGNGDHYTGSFVKRDSSGVCPCLYHAVCIFQLRHMKAGTTYSMAKFSEYLISPHALPITASH
ncbi:hypothetical protein C8F01DRAFT_191730 [Mycena amicta]|nr:hypothetical protein C8F01DRAFT_191730 [Mycena amicta]